jgi:hypothetical protein
LSHYYETIHQVASDSSRTVCCFLTLFFERRPKKHVFQPSWCCLCCSPPFKQLPAAAGAMTASDQQQEVDSVSQAELPIGSMPPGSNKGRQKKFHRHFKTVSAEERVLNCKYPLCCFFACRWPFHSQFAIAAHERKLIDPIQKFAMSSDIFSV